MAKPEKKNKEKKHFFKDFKAELKKVIWPTSKQVVNNTTAVITIVLLTALIVFVLDFAFEALNTYGINKLRNLVETTENVETPVDTDEATDETVEDENNEESNLAEQTENTVNETVEE